MCPCWRRICHLVVRNNCRLNPKGSVAPTLRQTHNVGVHWVTCSKSDVSVQFLYIFDLRSGCGLSRMQQQPHRSETRGWHWRRRWPCRPSVIHEQIVSIEVCNVSEASVTPKHQCWTVTGAWPHHSHLFSSFSWTCRNILSIQQTRSNLSKLHLHTLPLWSTLKLHVVIFKFTV